ncbi:MAG: PAS domain S-box protein [bacterium]
MTGSDAIKVLLVDDDEQEFVLLKRLISKIEHGRYALEWAPDWESGLEIMKQGRHDVHLVDYRLGARVGVDLIRAAVRSGCTAPNVLLTGQGSLDVDLEAMASGAADYLMKEQLDAATLERSLRYAIERHKALREVTLSEERLHDFLDNANDLIQSVGPDGRFLFVNRKWREVLGYTEAEAAGLSYADVIHPEQLAHCNEIFGQLLGGLAGTEIETVFRTKTGEDVHVSGHINCRHEAGKPISTRGIFRDITERKKAEAAILQLNAELEDRVLQRTQELQESEERYRNLVEGSIQGIVIHREGESLFANRAAASIFGYRSPEEFLGLGGFERLIAPGALEAFRAYCRARLGGETVATEHEFEGVKADGSVIWLRFAVSVVPWNKQPALLSALIDVTEARLAGDALQRSEWQLRQIVDRVPHMIFVRDLRGVYLLANRAMAEAYGTTVDKLVGVNHAQIRSSEEAARVREEDRMVVEGGRPHYIPEAPFRDAQGNSRILQVTKVPYVVDGMEEPAILGVAADITEAKHAEQKLRQAQKMEAIGSLAAGIAHDFNNILTPIVGYSDFILRRLEPGSQMHAEVDVINKASLRAKALVQQIVTFTRQTQAGKEPIGLGRVADEVVQLLESALPPTVKIEKRVEAALPQVMADCSQIHSILMNLCINARDAMWDGGRLLVAIESEQLRDRTLWNGEAISGHFVRIRVGDTGTGMDEATLSRIFDPFFTTKEVGQGTGLGLSTVYGIVRDHGGYIDVASRPGAGSTFDVYLPTIDPAAGAGPEGMRPEPLAPPGALGAEGHQTGGDAAREERGPSRAEPMAENRLRVAVDDGTTTIRILGDRPLDSGDVGRILEHYAVAEHGRSEVHVVCGPPIYRFLVESGFDRFLQLSHSDSR